MRIVYVATHDLTAKGHARVQIIAERLTWLAGRHELHLVCPVHKDEDRAAVAKRIPGLASITAFASPGAMRLGFNILAAIVTYRPLQTAVVNSTSCRRGFAACIRRAVPDVIIYDTFRADPIFRLAKKLIPGARHIADLDDLFSRRYRLMVQTGRTGGLVGEQAKRMPAWMTKLAEILSAQILRWEVATMARTERAAPSQYTRVTLVSKLEAEHLRAETKDGRKVVYIPLSAQAKGTAENAGDLSARVYFLGNYGYSPNADSAEYILTTLWPKVRERVPDAELHLIGRDLPAHLQRLASIEDGVHYQGYVDDLDTLLAGFGILLSPIRIGSGVKVKIVEGLMAGKAVVTTSVGAEGLDIEAGVHCLVEETPAATASAVVNLVTDRAARIAMGKAARQAFGDEFAIATVGKRWCALLADVMSQA
jgi:hypothetical protein